MNIDAMSRRDRRKEEVRARLLDCAVRLFARQGFAETSVSDIADAADVARATAFNYFPRKEDYFFAWMEARRTQIRTAVAAEADNGRDTAAQLLHGFSVVADLYEADATASRALTRAWMTAGGPLIGGAAESAAVIVEALKQGQDRGDIRLGIDAEQAGFMVLDVYLGTLCRWAAAGDAPLKGPLLAALELLLSALVEPYGAR